MALLKTQPKNFSHKTDSDLPYPQQTPDSNQKSVNLEPELEPLHTLIMLQHEVFTPHFIELGNISLTLSKDIRKKKENYSLLKDNKKMPRSLRVKVKLTTLPTFTPDTDIIRLKDKLKNIVSTFIQQGTDVMTEWAGKNLHLLHKERCHNILKKSLQILECILSYHSEVIIQPNWPSANPNHLTLFLFKIYFSGVYINRQDLQEFFELPTDVITLTGIKILTKQPNDKDALSIYHNLNLADINNSTDKEYEFIAETLNLFDQIVKTTTLSLWSYNQQSMKQATAVNNLKAKLTALQTLNATHATAMAIAKATESLNEKTSQDEYRELRISNLEKNLKKYEQKTNEIDKKIKNNINQNKKQKKIQRGPAHGVTGQLPHKDSALPQRMANGRPHR